MTRDYRYIVITPVRDEGHHFARMAEALVAQSIRPVTWVIVDDGSTDQTGAIADHLASKHDWIMVIYRRDRGFRQPGSGVMEAFYDGLAAIENTAWDFLVKLDGDIVFAPDYFQLCFEHFEREPGLGIGGGLVYRSKGHSLAVDSAGDPAFHVRGATKIYRKECWEKIGGLVKQPGWDTIDELKANMLGWKTRTFPELSVHQLKDTGSADGTWHNWVKNGRANFITGYHPVFMLCKCLKRLTQKPFGVAGAGLFFGFLSGYFGHAARLRDAELVRFVRREQLRTLTFRRSLWTI